jgi:hypothetical protein
MQSALARAFAQTTPNIINFCSKAPEKFMQKLKDYEKVLETVVCEFPN